MEENELLEEWNSFAITHNKDRGISELLFFEIIKHYRETHRHYHNLSHINNLLIYFRKYQSLLNDPTSVFFAIWFHDVIYNPLKKDNEKKSADLASVSLIKLNFPEKDITKVCKLILATENHTELQNNFDLSFFLDIDLSILGADEELYRKYSSNVRKEYEFVPKVLYRWKRKDVLKSFLKRESIFQTIEIKELLEQKARININNEIKSLRS